MVKAAEFASSPQTTNDEGSKTASMNPSSLAKPPISENNAMLRASARITAELETVWAKYGKGFADWWHWMSRRQRVEVLMDVTNDTLPKHGYGLLTILQNRENLKRVRSRLLAGELSACKIGFDAVTLLDTCDCASTASEEDQCQQHVYKHKLLHDLYNWATQSKEVERMEFKICKSFSDAGIFPSLFPEGLIAFVKPTSNDCVGSDRHDVEICMTSETAPPDVVARTKECIESGALIDASIAMYMLERKITFLSLLIKLFDTYQLQVRRMETTMPYERLLGCRHCRQTCENSDEAIKCKICTVVWWCCQGCKAASEHGRNCPNGRPMDAKVLFSG
jgi:hypothetical protein